MENAITTILLIGLLLFGAMTVSSSSMNAIDEVADSWRIMEQHDRNTRLTSITVASCLTETGGATLEVSIRNNGNSAVADFDYWDVIVRYSSGQTRWLSKTDATPGWSLNGITLASNGGSEVIDPGILNPGEAALLIVRLDPAVVEETDNWLIFSTPNGIKAETSFGW